MRALDQRSNVFGVFAKLRKVPFAVSRWNWADTDYVVVIKVIPKGDYGIAYGFPVRDDIPNDHFRGYRQWEAEMIMPNASSYQWRLIDVPESKLLQLMRTFQATVALRFKFGRPADESEEEFL